MIVKVSLRLAPAIIDPQGRHLHTDYEYRYSRLRLLHLFQVDFPGVVCGPCTDSNLQPLVDETSALTN